MGILNDVMQYRARKEADREAQANAIPQALMAYQQAKQQSQDNMLKQLTVQATLAKAGFGIGADGKLVKDTSFQDPLTQFINQGKVADSYNKQVTAGFLQPGMSVGSLASGGTVSGGSPTQPTSSGSATQDQDTFATGASLNVAGVPTKTSVKSESGMRREAKIKGEEAGFKKLAESETKTKIETKKASGQSYRFVQQFERSYDELEKKFGKTFDDSSLWGAGQRLIGQAENAAGALPETKAFLTELEPQANQMARDVEGGKITDADRNIYAKSFANTLKHPTETNIRLVSNQLISMADKGGDISKNIIALSQSKNAVLKGVAREVAKEYPEYKLVNIVDEETGEKKTVTLYEARRLRGGV